MKKILKKLRHFRDDKDGTTLVEVMVAFVIFLMIMAMFYGVVSFSSAIYVKATDKRIANENFNAEYSKKTAEAKKETVASAGSFSITVDTDKTSAGNQSMPATLHSNAGLKKYTDEVTGISIYSFFTDAGLPHQVTPDPNPGSD